METLVKRRISQAMYEWGPPSLVSLTVHGLALYLIVMLAPLQPPVKKVVQVDAISLTQVAPKPQGGQAGGAGAPPAPEPAKTVAKPPTPPPPPRVKPKPKPRPAVQPPPEPDPIPARLALPRPAPPAPSPRPAPASSLASNSSPGSSHASGRGTSSGSGSGSGSGAGMGSGSGSGIGSGRGYGPGSGSGRGSGTGSGTALQGYLAKVRSLLERHKIYPQSARSRSQQGTAVIRFTINADGSISGISLSRPSGHSSLDQAAQDTVNRVGRFPPIPGDIQKNSLTVQVPLAYRLQGG